MTLTRLWLVRHGESIANVAATQAELDGAEAIPIDIRDADVPLSPTGVEQAEAFGRWLTAHRDGIDAFYASPYLRARETLAIALREGAEPDVIYVDERLRDRELGILDLLTRLGIANRHPEEAERRRHLGKYYHRPPGGESWADVALRLRSFLHDVDARPATSALVVAHDAVVMLLVSLLLPLDEPALMEFAASRTVLNASVTHLVRTDGVWELASFSDVDHLQIEGAPVTVHPGAPMSKPSEPVTLELLRGWGLPDPGTSKKTRGRVIVVGGSRRTPGAVVLAGEAALRIGAGRLGVVVPGSVEAQLGSVMPEAAVFALPDQATDPMPDGVRDELAQADAVLVGPGFDDPDETVATLRAVAECGIRCLVLDAYALGILPRIDRGNLPDRLILNPNEEEAAILLDRDLGDDRFADLAEIARRYDAVVNCYGDVVDADGDAWSIDAGGPGLGTSGSGDVLAGAITGMAARGVEPARAAVWGAWAHATAGDRLTARTGIGFLARDIARELTPALNEAAR